MNVCPFLFNFRLPQVWGSDVLTCLCKSGLPEGNIHDFASAKILQFEKQWKVEQKRKEQLAKIKKAEEEQEALLQRKTSLPKKKKIHSKDGFKNQRS